MHPWHEVGPAPGALVLGAAFAVVVVVVVVVVATVLVVVTVVGVVPAMVVVVVVVDTMLVALGVVTEEAAVVGAAVQDVNPVAHVCALASSKARQKPCAFWQNPFWLNLHPSHAVGSVLVTVVVVVGVTVMTGASMVVVVNTWLPVVAVEQGRQKAGHTFVRDCCICDDGLTLMKMTGQTSAASNTANSSHHVGSGIPPHVAAAVPSVVTFSSHVLHVKAQDNRTAFLSKSSGESQNLFIVRHNSGDSVSLHVMVGAGVGVVEVCGVVVGAAVVVRVVVEVTVVVLAVVVVVMQRPSQSIFEHHPHCAGHSLP